MKNNFVLLLTLMFVISCGRNNDDNRFVSGVNALGQQCTIDTVNGYNNLNSFYNNNPYGQSNPYQLELARRCGYALNSGFNNGYSNFNNGGGFNNNFNGGFNNGFNGGFNNGFNGGFSNGNNGCFVASDVQNVAGVNRITRQSIVELNNEFISELNDVHGIQQPSVGQENHYYTQVGFYAGVNTGGGAGFNSYPYGPYNPQFGYGYCDMLSRF